MPKTGDSSVLCANKVLKKHGMVLRRANATYNQQGGYPFHLLKELKHKLLIHTKLVDIRHGTGATSHFISWDGKSLWDYPNSLRVN